MRLLFLLLLIPDLLFSEQEIDLDLDDITTEEPLPGDQLRHSALLKYYSEKERIEHQYRRTFGESLKYADKIEIYLLSFSLEKEVPESHREQYFYISPYGAYSKILKVKEISGGVFNNCRTETVKLLQQPYLAGPMGDFPIHGLRLYSHGEVIFETSLCWRCSTYFIRYPDDYHKSSWVGFDRSSIETILKKEMPIPQSEIDRFYSEMPETKGGREPWRSELKAETP